MDPWTIALFIGMPAVLLFWAWWIPHCDAIGRHKAFMLNEMDPNRVGEPDLTNAQPYIKRLYGIREGNKEIH